MKGVSPSLGPKALVMKKQIVIFFRSLSLLYFSRDKDGGCFFGPSALCVATLLHKNDPECGVFFFFFSPSLSPKLSLSCTEIFQRGRHTERSTAPTGRSPNGLRWSGAPGRGVYRWGGEEAVAHWDVVFRTPNTFAF